MIYRQSNNWKLWGGCHPQSIGCVSEGRSQCSCKYHITNGQDIYSFDDWQKAEDKFCSLTGEKKFVPGKTDFQGNSLIK